MFTVKNAKNVLFIGALSTALLGGSRIVRAEDETVNVNPNAKVIARDGDYCHLQFPAINPGTLGSRPQLKEWASDDIVDYYGACDHDPTGQEENQLQTYRQLNDLDDGE